jgi:hypothetical protein
MAKPLPIEDEAQTAVEEARMVLPGVQTILGFQLIALFSERFDQLSDLERHMHLAALVLSGVAMALIVAPAAYHRIAERHLVSHRFVRLTSELLAAGMAVLAVGISMEFYVAARLASEDRWIAAAIAAGFFILFAWLWFVFPLRHRRPPPPAGE